MCRRIRHVWGNRWDSEPWRDAFQLLCIRPDPYWLVDVRLSDSLTVLTKTQVSNISGLRVVRIAGEVIHG